MEEFWNFYSYCGGNPINFTDPNGMEVDPNSPGTPEAVIALTYLDQSKLESVIYDEQVYTTDQIWGFVQEAWASSALDALIALSTPKFGIQNYGNFGGKGWTGGVSGMDPPIDDYDFMTMLHDIDYAVQGVGSKVGYDSKATLLADRALVGRLNSLVASEKGYFTRKPTNMRRAKDFAKNAAHYFQDVKWKVIGGYWHE